MAQSKVLARSCMHKVTRKQWGYFRVTLVTIVHPMGYFRDRGYNNILTKYISWFKTVWMDPILLKFIPFPLG